MQTIIAERTSVERRRCCGLRSTAVFRRIHHRYGTIATRASGQRVSNVRPTVATSQRNPPMIGEPLGGDQNRCSEKHIEPEFLMKPSRSRTNTACFVSRGLIYVRMLLARKIYSHILPAIFVCRDIQARLIRLE